MRGVKEISRRLCVESDFSRFILGHLDTRVGFNAPIVLTNEGSRDVYRGSPVVTGEGTFSEGLYLKNSVISYEGGFDNASNELLHLHYNNPKTGVNHVICFNHTGPISHSYSGSFQSSEESATLRREVNETLHNLYLDNTILLPIHTPLLPADPQAHWDLP